MAGSIPPLVSSSPPPLSAFDDDEEEEEDEDEFGMYVAAEEDYNECISFQEKIEEKPNELKSRAEHDSTSQDSTTDSGMCPDSEGVSPTPNSDDERTVTQIVSGVNDKVDRSTTTGRLTPPISKAEISSRTLVLADVSNGHDTAHSDTDDDFGDFETPTQLKEQIIDSSENQVVHLERSVVKEEVVQRLEVIEEQVNSVVASENFNDIVQESNNFNDNLTSNNIFLHSDLRSTTSSISTVLETQNITDDLESQEDQTSLKESTTNNSIVILKPEQNLETNPGSEEVNQVDDEFDEFADFKADFSSFNACNFEQPTEESNQVEQKHLDLNESSVCIPENEKSDDEFSDFSEFSSMDCKNIEAQTIKPEVSPNTNVSSDISDFRTDCDFQDWTSVFPSIISQPEPAKDNQVAVLRDDDSVWKRLIPLEASPALSYQWADSLSNRHLLSSLSIDSRNILMMPWMPKFAANLSGGPLQPVKALEPLQPTIVSLSAPAPIHASVTQVSACQETVPDAHFDWVGSGLTNPLDSSHSSLLDLNIVMTLTSQLTTSPKSVLKKQKSLSDEAKRILSSLPDLSFMKKTYFVFPPPKET